MFLPVVLSQKIQQLSGLEVTAISSTEVLLSFVQRETEATCYAFRLEQKLNI
jgi:hypothetical protein